ncbi:uncharacterized protein B0T15DRAFT_3165 [Chaetomium strumarium]|uniref:Uncharacterized protein n=1 Tax=Chaetomium strumarium TaxID=1170767 RepID=A0AAJ0H084_9PEZI|nr:hypothetical protein B0T15DRAFT_3165 [Chaetomium strumarium]
MRPVSLPPLVIPNRRSPAPVLLGSYQGSEQRLREMPVPVSRFRLVHRSPCDSPRPEPRVGPLEHDFIDDIDLFKFYNPCLLPPTPIRPHPATQCAELPADSRDPAPRPDPSLRRSKRTVTRRSRSYRRHTHATGPYPRRARSRSPSQPPPYSAGPARARSPPPSPPRAPQPRRVSLPRWALWDLEDTPVADNNPYPEGQQDTPESDGTLDMGRRHNTPSLVRGPEDGGSRLGVVDECGYYEQQQAQQQEQAALRELWGVIDGMLGPGTNLRDYDARSVSAASSIYSPWDGVDVDDVWNDGLRQQGGISSSSSSSSSEDTVVPDGYEAPQKAGWWRSFRQGLLL